MSYPYEDILRVDVFHPLGKEINYIAFFPNDFRILSRFLEILENMLNSLDYKPIREGARYSATNTMQVEMHYVNNTYKVKVAIHYVNKKKEKFCYLVNINLKPRELISGNLDEKLMKEIETRFKNVNKTYEFY